MAELAPVAFPLSPASHVVPSAVPSVVAVSRPVRRRQSWLLWVGALVLAVLALSSATAPVLSRYDPLVQNARQRLQGPTAAHPFGTDEYGRDVLARVLYGGRTSLVASLTALAVALALGIPLGLVAGYAGGWVEGAVMRLVDVLYSFPSFLLALVVAGLYGPGLYKVLFAAAAVWWVDYARVVRAMVLQVKTEEYVLAARVLGASPLRVAVRAVLPQVIGPVVVLAALDLGALLLAISALSFLGLGAQPPVPEWGVMLAEGRRFFLEHQHLMVFPGAAIFLAALGFNLVGEGLRDVLDPQRTVGTAGVVGIAIRRVGRRGRVRAGERSGRTAAG
jgi:peptide/nickel transport system permease protein